MVVFSRLVPTALAAYGFQALCAAIFVPAQDDRFYDLCGALGWVSTTGLSLYYPSLKAKLWDKVPGHLPSILSFAPRKLLLSAAVGLWSVRLGTFLAQRAIKAGGDSRFEKIKTQPSKFSIFWLAQGTWIFLVGLPVWLVNTFPSSQHASLGPRDYLGLGLFASSTLFEVVADHQKTAWRRAKENKQHDERFISSGLWSISRHPNYVGEVGLWTGIYVLASTTLQTSPCPKLSLAAGALSPLFTWFLLRKVSGVPPLERSGDKKYGDDPAWQQYKKTVPIFFPWGPLQ